MNKKTKIIVTLLGITIIVLIGIGLVLSSNKEPADKKQILLTIKAIPSDAKIKVNGREVDETVYLSKGKHQIQIERFGFATQTFDQNFYENENIYINLIAVSEEALKWAEENSNLYYENEALSGEETVRMAENFAKKHPIIKFLPINNSPYYIIGYKLDSEDPTNIILTIRANQENRRNAIDEIYFKGYDPSDFKIEFIDPKTTYINPFTGGAN